MAKKFLPAIHILCSEDSLRNELQHIEICDGIATATNGHIIGQINLSEYGLIDNVSLQRLSGKLIHKDAWKILQDAENIEVLENDKILYFKGGVEAEISIKTDGDGIRFPDYRSIISKIANAKYDSKSLVAFNPEWIGLAHKIFKSDVLVMRFYAQEAMFILYPGSEAKAFIGIMPIEITDSNSIFSFDLV